MTTETTEIVRSGETNSPTEVTVTTITPLGVVVLGLAAVGGYVVTKRMVAEVRENLKLRREMKKLYKEHKKETA